jgi:hypothetical protein
MKGVKWLRAYLMQAIPYFRAMVTNIEAKENEHRLWLFESDV